MRILSFVLLVAALQAAIVADVRALLARQDFPAAEKLIETQRAGGAWTPELLEAQSWLGRGALAAKHYDKAIAYAKGTRKLALDLLKTRKLDDEARLPTALGATIEVEGQALAAKGHLHDALSFLNSELQRYHATSIRTRIQKNINLLSLVGKPAPALDLQVAVGKNPTKSIAQFKGKPVLLFFWAHWCADCKAQAPILAELARTYASKGLTIIGPTQYYGYAAGGEDATKPEERTYIASIYDRYYASIPGMSAPLSEENFRVYGASTTPTLVLIDRAGIVRLYHPGSMSKEELSAQIERLR
ncbi:TlpA family protein disulfide reductase [Bryobacter aggregatus]|uniref:TlpA family protein disulfide reductase n=1 Tax=Bryobacter aggregatus TaxID=360054 RepID=UPI0004E24C0D|nr:redoxin domain-containing protein [Bryobacter aggregatus]